jgi:hypothetical protein
VFSFQPWRKCTRSHTHEVKEVDAKAHEHEQDQESKTRNCLDVHGIK